MGNQLVHQGQGQGGIGAGTQGNVLVAFVGGFGATRVYADQAGAIALGHLGQAPEMQVAGNRIAAPNEDELGLGKKLHLHTDLAPQGLGQALGTGSGANRTVQQRRANAIEKARGDALALHQAHGACVAVGQDGFGCTLRDSGQPAGNVVQRGIPTHPLKLARAFGAHAFEWVQHALRVVAALGITRYFSTQGPVGVAVVWVALHLDSHAILHCGDQGAGIGAVMWARTSNLTGSFRETDVRGDADGVAHGVTL